MQSSDEVPQLLRFKDLQRLGITASWAGLRNLQDHQDFPLGKLLGPSTRVWTAAEVNAWLASRPTDSSEQTKARAEKSVAARATRVAS
jgi:predicted DNA-binding transcriptional regulator AlpA